MSSPPKLGFSFGLFMFVCLLAVFSFAVFDLVCGSLLVGVLFEPIIPH